MQKSQLKMMGAVAAVAVIAGGGIGVWSVLKDDSNGTVLLSAEEGAAARAQRDLVLPISGLGNAGSAALESKMAADSMPIDCGAGGGIYVPSPEELASANADTEALIAVLDKFGVTYTSVTDPSGFKYVETDYRDMVAQSVMSSFWDLRYPIVPPSQAELDDVVKSNDVIASYLDNAGIAYTRNTDASGWENLEWNYEDPGAQAAVDAAYAELYPPVPPTAEELASMTAENDKVAAAFDAAGIPYTRTSDELGWEWIDWDYNDEALGERVSAVYNELYPPMPVEDCAMTMDDSAAGESTADAAKPISAEAVDPAESGLAEEPPAATDPPVSEGSTVIVEPVPDSDMTPELSAERDAEATALATGFEAAGVTVRVEGESPWQIVLFDVYNDAAVQVVESVLASRG